MRRCVSVLMIVEPPTQHRQIQLPLHRDKIAEQVVDGIVMHHEYDKYILARCLCELLIIGNHLK